MFTRCPCFARCGAATSVYHMFRFFRRHGRRRCAAWWRLSAPGHRPAAGRDLREELVVEVLVELQRYAAAVAVEDDRRHRPPVEAVNLLIEIEGHLVAFVRRDGLLEVAALGLAYDDLVVLVYQYIPT